MLVPLNTTGTVWANLFATQASNKSCSAQSILQIPSFEAILIIMTYNNECASPIGSSWEKKRAGVNTYRLRKGKIQTHENYGYFCYTQFTDDN